LDLPLKLFSSMLPYFFLMRLEALMRPSKILLAWASVACAVGLACSEAATLPLRLVEAQSAGVASLADQLRTRYKLAKMVSDSAGLEVAEPGVVLIVQKGGILSIPPKAGYVTKSMATYKDGVLLQPRVGRRIFFGNNTQLLRVGERVYVFHIDVDLKQERILFLIVECDSCNGATQPSSYKSGVAFQFPKSYLENAKVEQVQAVIGEVLAIDTGTRDQPASAIAPQESASLPQDSTAPPQAQPVSTPERTKVHFTSSPTGGEIYVDGRFFGNTPSDITLPVGEHVVEIKIGDKEWSHSIEIAPGEITVHGDLDAQ
jgi:hypothetical protein